jgi:hypothetical protein
MRDGPAEGIPSRPPSHGVESKESDPAKFAPSRSDPPPSDDLSRIYRCKRGFFVTQNA